MIVNGIYIDDNLYQDKLLEVKTVLSSFYPDIPTSGPYEDLYIKPMALMLAYTQQNFYNFLFSFNLKKLQENISLYTDEQIDTILSFYEYTRQYISSDILSVIIYLHEIDTLTIPQGAIFNYQDKTFMTTENIYCALYPNENETKIFKDDETYYCYIQLKYVTLENITIPKGSELSMQFNIPGIISAKTLTDFNFSTDKETNEQFINRAINTFVPKATCSKAGLLAYLNKYSLVKTNIVSIGDTEMLRDADNIFELSLGGKVDVYIQSDISPEIKVLAKEAKLIDPQNHIWVLYITPEDLTGIYYIQKIISNINNTGSLDIIEINLSAEQSSHHIPAKDIYLSSYANIEIKFKYDIINEPTRLFYVYCYYDPYVHIIQQDIDNNFSPIGLDILVKSFYPVFLSIDCQLLKGNIDIDEFKRYLMLNINNNTMDITHSNIIELIHNYSNTIEISMPLKVFYSVVDDFSTYTYELSNTLILPDTNQRISIATIRPIILYEDISVQWI